MKKSLILLTFLAVMMPFSVLSAQNHKFGHLNSQTVIVLMPEYKKALDSLQKTNEKYSSQEKALQEEIQRKYSDLMEKQNTLETLILQSRYSELQNMQANLEQFQQLASEKLQKLQTDLLNSVINKLNDTVKKIAVELDLTYVFDTSSRNPMYASEKSIDIAPMVKEKLKL